MPHTVQGRTERQPGGPCPLTQNPDGPRHPQRARRRLSVGEPCGASLVNTTPTWAGTRRPSSTAWPRSNVALVLGRVGPGWKSSAPPGGAACCAGSDAGSTHARGIAGVSGLVAGDRDGGQSCFAGAGFHRDTGRAGPSSGFLLRRA